MSNKFSCHTIGLTGGIASGKSAVSQLFEELNVDVIDADIIAREVVEPNTKGLKQLIKVFGNHILTEDNVLDRSKLRSIVFNNADKLAKVNAILHPLIHNQITESIKRVNKRFCIIVIPLLCESNRYDWLDRILVVDVMPETQLERLTSRDSITKKLATKMMQSQCSRQQRLMIADDIINNEQALSNLKQQVDILNRFYKNLD